MTYVFHFLTKRLFVVGGAFLISTLCCFMKEGGMLQRVSGGHDELQLMDLSKANTTTSSTAEAPPRKHQNSTAKTQLQSGRKVPPRKHHNSTTKTQLQSGSEVTPGQLCLEFVHITKTGGTALESIAAASGLSWGSCKWINISTCNGVHGLTRTLSGGDHWHNPRTEYDCPNLFTVVRDPYTRMISEFYCKWAGYKGRLNVTAEILNTWLQQRLLSNRLPGWHFTRQANYIFGEGGRQRVKHVLHYENLEEEFNTLMKHYNMSLRYAKQKINASLMDRKLTISDFTEKTLTIINHVYAKDFAALGYAVKTERL